MTSASRRVQTRRWGAAALCGLVMVGVLAGAPPASADGPETYGAGGPGTPPTALTVSPSDNLAPSQSVNVSGTRFYGLATMDFKICFGASIGPDHCDFIFGSYPGTDVFGTFNPVPEPVGRTFQPRNASGISNGTTHTCSDRTDDCFVYGWTSSGSTWASHHISFAPVGSTTTVSASANASTFGQGVTFTAAVAPVSPFTDNPTGTVQFTLDGTNLGSAVTVVSGRASVSAPASLAVGTHAVTAAYSGDDYVAPSSGSMTQTVNKATPSMSVGGSPNPSLPNQGVTLTATVTGPGGVAAPTGSVQFSEGSTVLATAGLSGSTATVVAAPLAVGTHTITATFGGDGNYASRGVSFTQTVNRFTPGVSLSSSLNPSAPWRGVTFTATVTGPAGGPAPAGSVQFTDGATTLGTASLSGGQAAVTVASLAAGAHTVKATYSGDGSFNGGSATITQTVNKAAPTVSVISSPNPSLASQSVTFTVTVSGPAGAPVPTGQVQFADGGTSIGTVTLSGGQAVIVTSALAAGAHTVSASYGGDPNFSTGTGSASQTVNKSTPTVSLASTRNPSSASEAVTFVVTVNGPAGLPVPTGSVQLTDGGANLGPVLTLASGQAAFTIATLPSGSHPIAAAYAGDGNYSAASSSLTQTVNRGLTTTGMSSSANPSSVGDPVTLTAAVVGPSAAILPTGTVSFTVDGAPAGTVTLDGSAHAAMTTSVLSPGTHSVSATYNGDANFQPSSSGVVTQTVRPRTGPPPADFDGDRRTDIAVFRSPSGSWFTRPSGGGADTGLAYGQNGDVPVPADYDGDGRVDTAIYRPSTGLWSIHRSSDGIDTALTYGVNTDVPVPGDYDGDGKADVAVFRPDFGGWYYRQSSTGTDVAVTFGVTGDVPVVGDYDGDGRTDIAVFRPGSSTWFVHPSGGGADMASAYGSAGDVPVPSDYDGDGKTDVAIYRPSTGLWSIHRSGNGADTALTYGVNGDVPVPGDYDGDGKADVAVFRPPFGGWYYRQTSTGTDLAVTFGVTGDSAVALPAAIRSRFFA